MIVIMIALMVVLITTLLSLIMINVSSTSNNHSKVKGVIFKTN